MKRCILTALIVLAALMTAAALAEGGTCGEGLTWTLSSDGVLTVSGTGEMTDGEDYGAAPWDDIKTSIREIVIGDGVESVGDYMFWNCGNVTSVTLGDDVRRIGKAAFLYCESLPAVQLPPNIEYVDDWAFIHCKALARVYVPFSLNYFGDVVFYSCPNLTDIYFEGDRMELDAGSMNVGTDEEHIAEFTVHLISTANIPSDAVDDEFTKLIIDKEGEHPYPYENFIGVAICLLVLFGIVRMFRRV